MKVSPRLLCRLILILGVSYIGFFGTLGQPEITLPSMVALFFITMSAFILMLDFFFGFMDR